MPENDPDITIMLRRCEQGEPEAPNALINCVYSHLRKMAQVRMLNERRDHTFDATDLVHEAYLRLDNGGEATSWKNRAQYFHAASESMRRILIEHARKKHCKKRGGGFDRVPSNMIDFVAAEDCSAQVLALDEAFQQIEAEDERVGQIVRLRFFNGLSVEETAEVLGVSRRTVIREWTYARARIFQELAA